MKKTKSVTKKPLKYFPTFIELSQPKEKED